MTRILLMLAVFAPLSVAAQPAPPAVERPALAPARDAVVGYHLAPATGEAIDVRVALRAGGRALRMDLPDQSYMIASPPSRSLVLVVPLERTALDLPWADGPQSLFLLDEKMRFTRKAEATIAGQRCVVWDTVLDRARSTVCVTNDGLVLRSTSLDPLGRRNLIEAFAVRFDSLAEVDYAVPSGFERLTSTTKDAPQ